MSRLKREKLHVLFAPGTTPTEPLVPRRYTLTHSDATGDLFLTIGGEYDNAQLSGWQARLMRDEVLAEWQVEGATPGLHVHCHVSGGLLLGPAGVRDAIFRRELPLALEALRHGDGELFATRPELDQATVWVHFHSSQARYNRVEDWGRPADYAGEPD